MPFIIQHLIPETQNLVTVTENDSAQHALSLMIEHDFSQLPVIASDQTLKGMVTSDSVLRAVSYFKVIPKELKVSHAIVKAKPRRDDEDLSELLSALRDTSAVPIVDNAQKLVAIVTNYDTAGYFHRRFADLMYAEDIELTLRDLVRAASASDADEPDNSTMSQFIQAAMPSGKEQKKKFKNALMSYVAQVTEEKHSLNQSLLDSTFEQHLCEDLPRKTFKELTLSELIRVVQKLWPDYHQADFNDMTWDVVGPLLDEARRARNAIAHFNEVTDHQRRQLRFCAEFLNNHRQLSESADTTTDGESLSNKFDFILPTFEGRTSKEFLQSVASFINRRDGNQSGSQESSESISYYPSEEEIEPDDSRYAPLAIWLQHQEEDKITHTFKEIEVIIDDELPPSARNNRSWWANDSIGHVQSKQWLDVDWRVSSVNISAERVVFSRIGDRQSSYINFFNQLQNDIKHIKGLSAQPQINPQGRNWSQFLVSRENCEQNQPLLIGFSFGRKSRFRIEVYINEREQKQNTQIFEKLYEQKTEIEKEFGAELSWERLRARHGTRIACYRQDSTIENTEALDEIQGWAIKTLPKFYAALYDRFIAAKKEIAIEKQP